MWKCPSLVRKTSTACSPAQHSGFSSFSIMYTVMCSFSFSKVTRSYIQVQCNACRLIFAQGSVTGSFFKHCRVILSSSKLKMTLQNGSVISAHSCSSTADKNNTLRWDLTPEEIRHQTQRLIQQIKQAYDAVGSVDIGKVCFENTLQAVADAKADYSGEWME